MPPPGSGDEEEAEITEAQRWVEDRGLRVGIESFALLALDGQSEEAVLDVAWPDGLDHGEERVALLLNESADVLEAAGRHGYRFFTSVEDLKRYAERQLAGGAA